MKIKIGYFYLFTLNFILFSSLFSIPKMTIVLVIDQFAYSYIEKLNKNFNYALKDLLENGVNITNAHHPHGTPSTATGHTALSTGVFAKDHGIINNSWFTLSGKKIKCDDDNSKKTLVFGKGNNLQSYGKSAKNVLRTNITNKFVQKYPNYKTYSISLKSRAAIGMSGKKGKPIWFDKNTGEFTSSKAFFDQKPDWIANFNKNYNINNRIKNYTWSLFYPAESKYYNFDFINFHKETNYKHVQDNKTLINDKTLKNYYKSISDAPNYPDFIKTPLANKMILDFSQNCIDNNFKNKPILLWISLSPLDHLGHIYGPDSIETTDMIYHLDKQIQEFMQFLNKKIGEENILFVLTADHGIKRNVEISQRMGFDAHRIDIHKLTKEINSFIKNKYNIKNILYKIKTSQCYLDKKIKNLSEKTKIQIIKDIKKIILSKPGIYKVYTYDELKNTNFEFDAIENFYKQQLYPKRSGQIFIIPNKYSTVTNKKIGTAHRSGHKCNTHVPLIIYQKNKYSNKTINKKTWIPQVPATLAKILKIEKPKDCQFELIKLD